MIDSCPGAEEGGVLGKGMDWDGVDVGLGYGARMLCEERGKGKKDPGMNEKGSLRTR